MACCLTEPDPYLLCRRSVVVFFTNFQLPNLGQSLRKALLIAFIRHGITERKRIVIPLYSLWNWMWWASRKHDQQTNMVMRSHSEYQSHRIVMKISCKPLQIMPHCWNREVNLKTYVISKFQIVRHSCSPAVTWNWKTRASSSIILRFPFTDMD